MNADHRRRQAEGAGGQLGHRLRQSPGLHVGEHDRRACGEEPFAQSLADPGRASGDDDDASSEP
jgi:hypothetical protein